MNKDKAALPHFRQRFFLSVIASLIMAKKTEEQELGFGKYIMADKRMLRPDGRFNVKRVGVGLADDLYFTFVEMSWWRFLSMVFVAFFLINVLFATGYYLIGAAHLAGIENLTGLDAWLECYFFSSQTLTTVGYGRISPIGLNANLLASFESFLGLLSFALISGLLYGRFSRAVARIAFSENLLISPFKGGTALMFRIANKNKSELINASAEILIAFNETDSNGNVMRAFRNLPLEVNHIMFFSMSWTLVHSINEESLLYGMDHETLAAKNPEFLILITATEEANQQSVHARYSYMFDDLVWNARFMPMVSRNKKGIPTILLDNLSDYETVQVVNHAN